MSYKPWYQIIPDLEINSDNIIIAEDDAINKGCLQMTCTNTEADIDSANNEDTNSTDIESITLKMDMLDINDYYHESNFKEAHHTIKTNFSEKKKSPISRPTVLMTEYYNELVRLKVSKTLLQSTNKYGGYQFTTGYGELIDVGIGCHIDHKYINCNDTIKAIEKLENNKKQFQAMFNPFTTPQLVTIIETNALNILYNAKVELDKVKDSGSNKARTPKFESRMNLINYLMMNFQGIGHVLRYELSFLLCREYCIGGFPIQIKGGGLYAMIYLVALNAKIPGTHVDDDPSNKLVFEFFEQHFSPSDADFDFHIDKIHKYYHLAKTSQRNKIRFLLFRSKAAITIKPQRIDFSESNDLLPCTAPLFTNLFNQLALDLSTTKEKLSNISQLDMNFAEDIIDKTECYSLLLNTMNEMNGDEMMKCLLFHTYSLLCELNCRQIATKILPQIMGDCGPDIANISDRILNFYELQKKIRSHMNTYILDNCYNNTLTDEEIQALCLFICTDYEHTEWPTPYTLEHFKKAATKLKHCILSAIKHYHENHTDDNKIKTNMEYAYWADPGSKEPKPQNITVGSGEYQFLSKDNTLKDFIFNRGDLPSLYALRSIILVIDKTQCKEFQKIQETRTHDGKWEAEIGGSGKMRQKLKRKTRKKRKVNIHKRKTRRKRKIRRRKTHRRKTQRRKTRRKRIIKGRIKKTRRNLKNKKQTRKRKKIIKQKNIETNLY